MRREEGEKGRRMAYWREMARVVMSQDITSVRNTRFCKYGKSSKFRVRTFLFSRRAVVHTPGGGCVQYAHVRDINLDSQAHKQVRVNQVGYCEVPGRKVSRLE